MKTKIFILIVIFYLIFLNCVMPEPDYNWYNIRVPNEIESYSSGIKIYNWVIINIEYRKYANGFHSAQQTLNEMQGNCANIALTILALWYKLTGEKGKLVYCLTNIAGENKLHYSVKIDGHLMSEKYIIKIYDIIDFDDIAEYIYYRQ